MVFSFFPPGFPWQTHPSSTLPAAPCRRSALPQRDPSWRFTQQSNFRRSFHGFSFGEVFSSIGSPAGVVLICVGWWLGPGAYVWKKWWKHETLWNAPIYDDFHGIQILSFWVSPSGFFRCNPGNPHQLIRNSVSESPCPTRSRNLETTLTHAATCGPRVDWNGSDLRTLLFCKGNQHIDNTWNSSQHTQTKEAI